jgi:alkylation response protein AidB-like acyl-CoA dehydrogenase
LERGPTDADAALWSAMVEGGYTGLLVGEEFGGGGASLVDIVPLLENLGRSLAPWGVVSSAVLAARLLGDPAVTGADAYLSSVADGSLRLAVADLSYTGSAGQQDGSEGALVVSGPGASAYVVLSRDRLSVLPADAPGIAVVPVHLMDQTRSFARLSVTDSETVRGTSLLLTGEDAERLGKRLALLNCLAVACDSVGGAAQIHALTVEHAKTREQFGRPIGSFQALKHVLADLHIGIEAARSAVLFAAWAIDEGSPAQIVAATTAKLLANQVFTKAADAGVQFHGGIGFSWEHDAHLFVKRSKVNESVFGSARVDRRVIAEQLIDGAFDVVGGGLR